MAAQAMIPVEDDPEFIQEDLRWVRVEAVQGFATVTVRFDHILDATTLLAFREYQRLPDFGPNGRPNLEVFLDDFTPPPRDIEYYQYIAELITETMGNTHVILAEWQDYLEGGLYF